MPWCLGPTASGRLWVGGCYGSGSCRVRGDQIRAMVVAGPGSGVGRVGRRVHSRRESLILRERSTPPGLRRLGAAARDDWHARTVEDLILLEEDERLAHAPLVRVDLALGQKQLAPLGHRARAQHVLIVGAQLVAAEELLQRPAHVETGLANLGHLCGWPREATHRG
eukprot:873526-Prymnesium_polylepis.1